MKLIQLPSVFSLAGLLWSGLIPNEVKAEEARRRAEARLAEKLDDEETALVSAALAQSLAQLKVKRRQHR